MNKLNVDEMLSSEYYNEMKKITVPIEIKKETLSKMNQEEIKRHTKHLLKKR